MSPWARRGHEFGSRKARVLGRPGKRSPLRERISALPRPAKLALVGLGCLAGLCTALLEPPLITTPGTDFGGVLFTVAVYMLVALGLNIVVGYAGLLDLGYVAFYAVGAYTVAVLTSEHGNLPYLLTIPIAIGVAMLAGLALGAPTLRVRGDYLAIVTLGFGEIVRLTLVNTRLVRGRRRHRPNPPAAEHRAVQDSRISIGIRACPWWTSGRPQSS